VGGQLLERHRDRLFIVAFGVVLAAATVLRLIRLDHFSYWLDEILEARFVQGSWPEFWKALRFDAVHPPLDYLIVRGVESLHPSDWVRKIPAALWGVGAIAALGALLNRRAGRLPALFGMALLAFAPYHVRYSQELRPYSLGLFLLCVSLLCLDSFLGKPGILRLAVLYLAVLSCAYSLYLAAFLLAISGTALVAEDCFSADVVRGRSARRFLAASPVFVGALFLGYLPWWPVLREAIRRPPPVGAEPLTLARLDRTVSFFTFAPYDGSPLGWPGIAAALLMASGVWFASRRQGLRFLAIWAPLGFLLTELLGRIRPHFFAPRWFLPAGIALTALAGVAIAGAVGRTPITSLAPFATLGLMLAFSIQGLATYYQIGRPDWRPLADFLSRQSAPADRIFTENQYTQLCLDFYLFQESSSPLENAALNVNGEVRPLAWSWPRGARAWLVLGGGPKSEELRRWAEPFPELPFPSAEGYAVVKRLDPSLRDEAIRRVR
jgi:hypothetical protein